MSTVDFFFLINLRRNWDRNILFHWRLNCLSTGKREANRCFCTQKCTNVNRTSKRGDRFLDKTFAMGSQKRGGSDHFAMYNVAT